MQKRQAADEHLTRRANRLGLSSSSKAATGSPAPRGPVAAFHFPPATPRYTTPEYLGRQGETLHRASPGTASDGLTFYPASPVKDAAGSEGAASPVFSPIIDGTHEDFVEVFHGVCIGAALALNELPLVSAFQWERRAQFDRGGF